MGDVALHVTTRPWGRNRSSGAEAFLRKGDAGDGISGLNDYDRLGRYEQNENADAGPVRGRMTAP